LIIENINETELCRAGKKGDGFLPAKAQNGFWGIRSMVADIKQIKIFGAARGLRAKGRACGIAEDNIKNSKARGASPTQPLNNKLMIKIRAGQVVSRVSTEVSIRISEPKVRMWRSHSFCRTFLKSSLANAEYQTKHDGNLDYLLYVSASSH